VCKLLSVYWGSNKWYLEVDGLVSFAGYHGCLEARVVVCVIRTLMLTLEQVPRCASVFCVWVIMLRVVCQTLSGITIRIQCTVC